MHRAAMLLVLPFLATPAVSAEIVSEYTDIDIDRTCSVHAINEEGGEFASFVCPGWKGYPVIIDTGDLRESVFYGFPKPAEGTVWESFSAFNGTAQKIEWRIEKDGQKSVPFAVIHRWFVSDDPDEAERKTEVLAVEKVGQIGVGEGCTVGLVVATGNPKANETARRIADEQARQFACGADERVLVSGDVPMPDFDRQEN